MINAERSGKPAMCRLLPIVFMLIALFTNLAASAERLKPMRSVTLSGDIKALEDVSAVEKIGTFLVIGADEGTGAAEDENVIQVLKKVGDNHYTVSHDLFLFKGDQEDGEEMDIEGLAVSNQTVYIIGSHAARRKRAKPDEKYQKNRKRFHQSKIDDAKNRAWLYRLDLDSQGRERSKHKISLRKLLRQDDVLRAFASLPSKENGIDIEGLAVQGAWLYLGFRGPVFRDNYVPVMTLQYDDPKDTAKLLYVNLGGRGIRAMTRVSDGFLLIAGPVGDGPGSYQLYHWDGRDMLLGSDRKPKDIGCATMLGDIWAPEGGKAEGIMVLHERHDVYELIIVYDGVKDSVAQRFHVKRP